MNIPVLAPLDPSRPPPPHVLQALEHQVEYALFFVLDKEVTKDYFKAREIIPEIVKQESKMVDFLTFEGFHPFRAAERLSKYWKARKFFFDDRWLLPMVQTGWGAQSPEKVEILRTGYLLPLKSHTLGYVTVFDYSKLRKEAAQVQWQILFYACSVLAGHTPTQLVVIQRGYQRPTLQVEPHLFQKLRESMAYRVNQFIVAQAWEFGFEHLLEFLAHHERTFIEAQHTKSTRQYDCRRFGQGNAGTLGVAWP